MKTFVALDYSMPDFNTRKTDGKIIGTRLANILEYMDEHKTDHTIQSMLIAILCEQEPRLQFAIIEKMKILNIRKAGHEITITLKVRIGTNPFGIKNKEIVLTFTDGTSKSIPTNDLFIYIFNYVR